MSKDLTQMVNFPTRIPNCDYHSPALLDFVLFLTVVWQIANSVLNKGKFAIPPLFNNPEVLSSACDK